MPAHADQSVPALSRALEVSETPKRVEIAVALQRLGAERDSFIFVLEEGLSHPNKEVQQRAAAELQELSQNSGEYEPIRKPRDGQECPSYGEVLG